MDRVYTENVSEEYRELLGRLQDELSTAESIYSSGEDCYKNLSLILVVKDAITLLEKVEYLKVTDPSLDVEEAHKTFHEIVNKCREKEEDND